VGLRADKIHNASSHDEASENDVISRTTRSRSQDQNPFATSSSLLLNPFSELSASVASGGTEKVPHSSNPLPSAPPRKSLSLSATREVLGVVGAATVNQGIVASGKVKTVPSGGASTAGTNQAMATPVVVGGTALKPSNVFNSGITGGGAKRVVVRKRRGSSDITVTEGNGMESLDL